MVVIFYLLFNAYEIYNFQRRFYHKGRLLESVINSITKLLKKSRGEVIEERLVKAGRPLGLVPETYVLTKAGICIFAIVYSRAVEMECIQTVIFITLAFFALDIYLYFKIKDIKNAFHYEMPEIVDVFELGATSDIPLDDTFLLATDFAERKEVKRELAKLSAEYFITKDKEGCLNKFSRNVNLPEANVLAMALLQGERTGRTLEILSSLSSSLFNTAIAKVAREGKSMEYKVLAATFILMASIFTLYMYPYFSNLEGGLKTIF